MTDSDPPAGGNTTTADWHGWPTPVTGNILTRVMRLETPAGQGTGFTLELLGRDQQYLVTAEHVLPPAAQDPVHLTMRVAGGVSEAEHTRLPLATPPSADVAVFALGWPATTSTLPVVANSDGMTFSQDAYILGYPSVGGTQIRGAGEAFAFVKKAIISALTHEPGGVQRLYLDGHSNPGFSGGPVVFARPGHRDPHIAGVVIGSVFEEVQTYSTDPTDLVVAANSGIIVATDIGHVIEAIRRHSEATFGPLPADDGHGAPLPTLWRGE
jgi:hypothetical protein